MVPFNLRRALESAAATAAALVLAALAPPVIAETRTDDDFKLEQIQEILSLDGPYSLRLLEPLTSLGLSYRERGNHVLALVTLERAVHIVRVNKGLHTLEQVPLVRQLIRIDEERGNDEAAWDREQALLALVRRHPDDLRTVPVLREIADKRMDLLAAVLSGRRPPQVVLGCFYKQWPSRDDGSCSAGSKKHVVQGILAEAQRNYADAIGVMLRQGLYASEDLRALELEMLRGVDLLRSVYADRPVPLVPAFIGSSNIEPWRGRIEPVAELANWDLPYPDGRESGSDDGGHSMTKYVHLMDPYHRGRQSLRRLYAYDAAVRPNSLLQQADAVVQMADWDLLYSHNGQAAESYAAAYAMLAKADSPAASIEELFAPATPVVLPAFKPNPLARDEKRAATGHIDVAFEITKYGRGRGVEFLGDANATDDAMQSLETLIKSNRFRPRVTDGQFADAVPVRVRYYLY